VTLAILGLDNAGKTVTAKSLQGGKYYCIWVLGIYFISPKTVGFSGRTDVKSLKKPLLKTKKKLRLIQL